MSNQNSSISCIDHGENLIYGLWDGTVRIINNNTTSSISLNSPATAIHTHLNAVYIGTVNGDVWEIRETKVVRLIKAEGSINYTDLTMQSVIGIHGYTDQKIIVTYIYGEIIIYNTSTHTVEKRIKMDRKITSSYFDKNKVLCILAGKTIEVYDINTSKSLHMKALLSNTTIDHIIFMKNTEQDTIVYSTPVGKVCVDYVSRPGTGFVFKAHKKITENNEVYYPVTLIKQIGNNRLLTGGADGELYLWDVKEKTKVQTILSTKKCILTGDVRKKDNEPPATAILVLADEITSLCEIEGVNTLIEVPLAEV